MATELTTVKPPSIIAAFGDRYGMDANKVISIVQETVFRASKPEDKLSTEEVAAALIVCNQYELNPFTKEIFCFRSKGKILIVVSVDGWSTIINRQVALDGIEFEEHFDESGKIYSVTCVMYRKDRKMPTKLTEYTHECKRDTIPWGTMPIRMTRNRAFVQCARITFSISGLIDEDEAQTIEGYPTGDKLEVPTAWSTEQIAQVEELLKQVNWSAPKISSFRKQYADRPADGIDYLRKEAEKMKRITPKKQADPVAQPAPAEDLPPGHAPKVEDVVVPQAETEEDW
jgi:phage recombination protein Bet